MNYPEYCKERKNSPIQFPAPCVRSPFVPTVQEAVNYFFDNLSSDKANSLTLRTYKYAMQAWIRSLEAFLVIIMVTLFSNVLPIGL